MATDPHESTPRDPAPSIHATITTDPDDRSWYPPRVGVPKEDNNGRRQAGKALSLNETIAFGKALLNALRADDNTFREKYYDLSRTWHVAFKASGEMHGGKFGEQWCTLLELNLVSPVDGSRLSPGTLKLDDFANLHKYAFYSLRREMLALTSHDFHPDAADDNDKPGTAGGGGGQSKAALPILVSVHFGPNDGSTPTFSQADLGLPEGRP